MAELRSTTFQLEFNGQDGITGIRQFTRAVTDADKTVDELSKSLGENVTVTAKNIKSKKELTADARRLASQLERNNKRTEMLSKEYAHLAKLTSMTADEQQVLNATYRLGESATDAQRQAVAESVMEYQRLRDANEQLQPSMRNTRGIMQNFGWQMQDTIVQLQMGTSAFVVLSQQGSQMAAAFGPTGAVVGAVIALAGVVGGTLFAGLMDSSTAMERLEKSTEEVRKVFEVAEDGTITFTNELRKLYEVDKQLAKLRLQSALMDAETAVKESGKGIIDAFDEIGVAWYNLTVNDLVAGGKGVDYIYSLTESLTGLEKGSEGFFDTANKVRYFVAQIEKMEKVGATESTINSFYESLKSVETVAKDGSKEFNTFIKTSLDLVVQFKQGQLTVNELKDALANLDTVIEETSESSIKAKEATGEFISALAFEASTVAMSERALEDYNLSLMSIPDNEKTLAQSLYSQIRAFQDADAAFQEGQKNNAAAIKERQKAQTAIGAGQSKQMAQTDPRLIEEQLYVENMRTLALQKADVYHEDLVARQTVDALIEGEVERHTARLAEIGQQSLLSELGTYQVFLGQLGGLFQQVSAFAEEGSKEAEALFYINQAVAMANAVVSTEMAAAKALELGPILGVPAATMVRGLGYASVGIIAGQTIAGAFDKGGYIPSNQVGIVSEYGDELVNGQLVKGPARVTSREDTAKMMNGGGNGATNIIIENRIAGASYREQRIDADTVKIIAEQVFSDNIDSGVSGVLGNRNSKSTKALKGNFNTRSKY